MSARCARMRHAPYPELVEPLRKAAPWRVFDSRELRGAPSPGMVDSVQRKIAVPLEAAGGPIALHELAHVRWSPFKLPRTGVPRGVVLAVEDARINLGLRGLGLGVHLSARERALVAAIGARDLARRDHMAFVLRAIASVGTNGLAALCASADDDPRPRELASRWCALVAHVLEAERACRGKAVARFSTAVRLARELAREFDVFAIPGSLPSGCACVHAFGEGDVDDDELGLHGEPGRRPRRRRAGQSMPDDGPPAGRLSTTVAPLEVRCATARGGRAPRWRASRRGSVLRYPHRLAIDGAIFRRRSHGPGGTVLVDVSGSMSLEADDVERLIAGAPWATLVAIYSGRGSEGELRVVARDGRRARGANLSTPGRGNVVDLPALQWLAKRPAPRVWLSDGLVTGTGDTPSQRLRDDCERVCARARIHRVRTVDEAARLLRA